MSEIDSLASFGQQSLLTDRQRLSVREPQEGSQNSVAAQQNSSVRTSADAVTRAAQSETRSNSDRQPSQDQSRSLATRAQKAEIEAAAKRPVRKPELGDNADRVDIRNFDVGRRPAEVVGTFDAVQRFDGNEDGRVDRLESQKASQARDENYTYSAIARPSREPSIAEQVAEREISQAFLGPDEPFFEPSQPVSQPVDGGSTSRPAPQDPRLASDLPADEKLFADREAQVDLVQAQEPKKLFDKVEDVARGQVSGEVQADRKIYGEGVEVIRGRFATDADVQKKLFDDADALPAKPSGDVVQTAERSDVSVETPERGRFAEEDGTDRKLYSNEEFDNSGAIEDGTPKKIYSELELYADVAGLSPDNAETVVVDGPASVVKVTA